MDEKIPSDRICFDLSAYLKYRTGITMTFSNNYIVQIFK